MTRRQGTSQFVAALAGLALSGCGTVGLFGEYDIPESPDVAAAPYPRLVDVPEAPPPGVYTETVPDPVEGMVAQAELGRAASMASIRAAQLARTDPGAGVAGRAGADAVIAAANARAAALSAPVISPAERQALLARAQQARQAGRAQQAGI